MSTENSKPAKPLQTTAHRFEVGAGQVFEAGKPKWPDFLRLEIPRGRALTFAMDILRQLENAPFDNDPFVSVPVFGLLEPEVEEGSGRDSQTLKETQKL